MNAYTFAGRLSGQARKKNRRSVIILHPQNDGETFVILFFGAYITGQRAPDAYDHEAGVTRCIVPRFSDGDQTPASNGAAFGCGRTTKHALVAAFACLSSELKFFHGAIS